jgi:nitrate reductase NapAB chaperone NapD
MIMSGLHITINPSVRRDVVGELFLIRGLNIYQNLDNNSIAATLALKNDEEEARMLQRISSIRGVVETRLTFHRHEEDDLYS